MINISISRYIFFQVLQSERIQEQIRDWHINLEQVTFQNQNVEIEQYTQKEQNNSNEEKENQVN
ncbi:unnamed protein product [Paramecium octaurelia]|uniref:Uncharacterized protein n=1 Tax=Paramecium octaurelia TaxID=43137 RepID=A0A8S1YN07_PAROT|nr:unnamed protein product [Paramecium octaurelia]